MVNRFFLAAFILIVSLSSTSAFAQDCNCTIEKKPILVAPFPKNQICICGRTFDTYNDDKIVGRIKVSSNDTLLLDFVNDETTTFLMQRRGNAFLFTHIDIATAANDGHQMIPDKFKQYTVRISGNKGTVTSRDVPSKMFMPYLRDNFKKFNRIFY